MSFDPSELLSKSPLGIVVCDENHRITWCNERFLSETHLAEDQVVNQLYAALPIEAIDKQTHMVQLFTDESDNEIKFQYWQEKLSQPNDYSVHYFAKERANGKKLSIAVSKLAGVKIKRASWVEFLEYEVSRSRRYDNPLSILKLHLLVLDKPDNIDDSVLHDTIKDTLADELRWADMIGNTDHGTYLMVLPETPESALHALKEKLTKALTAQFNFVNKDMDYRFVFGGANWRKHDDSQQLLKRARARLVEQLESLLADSQ